MAREERRVLTVDGKGEFAVIAEPLPEVGPGTVLVDVKAALISPGTELGGVAARRKAPTQDGPRPFGYGNAGVVREVGEGVKGLEPGMPVACMGAGYALHADKVVVPQNLVAQAPEGMAFDEAAFAHLAATALHAVRRGETAFGENVIVMGLGVLGQLVTQVAKASGAHVMGVDRVPLRLDMAARCGADETVDAASEEIPERALRFTRGYGMDKGFVAFGGDATEAMRRILETMKVSPDGHRMGAIVVVGGASFSGEWPVPFGNVDVRASSRPGPGYHDVEWEHGRDYPGCFVQWTTRRNLEEVLRAAQEGRLRFAPLITHRTPLARAAEACEMLVTRPQEAVGVILEP